MVGALFSNLRRRQARISAAAARSRSSSCATCSCRQFDGMTLQTARERSLTAARCSRCSCRVVLDAARVEGRDPRDVPERRPARPARIVRDPRRRRRRRGSSSARTSATSRSPKRRRSPASSSRRRRSRRSTTRRAAASAATSCCRRWSTPATSRRTPRTAPRTSRSPSSSARSRPKRRTSSTTSARRSPSSIPGLTTTTTQAVDVYTTLDLHLQRLAQDAVRDGLTHVDELLARRKRKGTGGGGAHRRRSADRRDPRDGRRPLVQPVAVQPRDRRRAASPDRCSSRSSTSTAFEQAAAEGRTDVTPASIVDDEPDDLRVRRSGVDAGELRDDVRRPDHAAATRSRIRATSATINVAAGAPATTTSPRSGRSSASATPPKAVSVDRARRVRGDAVRDRDGLHDLSRTAAWSGR